MTRILSSRLGRSLAPASLAVAGLFALAVSPVGKPADAVRTLVLMPEFHIKRESIRSATNGRGLPHLPRFVEVRTDGAKVRAYLLDLSKIEGARGQVEAFMAASEAIDRGEAPPPTAVIGEAADVTQTRFDLHHWPWGGSANYMLIVAGDPGEVTVRVSYGG